MKFKMKPLVGAMALALMSSVAHADSLLGDLLVSTSYYGGNTSTVTIGQSLSTGTTATANGAYNNVFQNNVADGNFGVTSGITLETFNAASNTQTGSVDITAQAAAMGINLATSFSSKSELALNVSTDGQSVTFMGYNSAINKLDISNSSTPGLVDTTNTAGGIAANTARAIGQVNLSTGALQVINTNAYSGNNARAVVAANGQYYIAGNAGNSGSGVSNTTLNALSANTGVQVLNTTTATQTGGAYNTTVVGQLASCAGYTSGQCGPTSGKGVQYGFSLQQTGQTPDKTGKDDNFRGETVFNGTLYVTKGSGSNGINTVYQVGATGALLNGGTIDPTTATITPLPGLNLVTAKTATTGPNPFGIWFANATTMYVADEGDGVIADASKSTSFGGLEKWTFDGTKWNMAYTLTNGLNLGTNYTVTGGLNPDGSVNASGTGYSYTTATDGLRNITGKVNADGTVTIYGVTSTVSGAGDQGADPNKLVEITDSLTNGTSNEQFSTLQTAAYGQVLRGVAVAPVPEADSYELMAVGLGLVGFIARRRKTA